MYTALRRIDISGIFLKSTHAFRLYTDYINRFDAACTILAKKRKKKREFAKFLDSVERDNPSLGGGGLESALISPVQRLPRYCLLMQVSVCKKFSVFLCVCLCVSFSMHQDSHRPSI